MATSESKTPSQNERHWKVGKRSLESAKKCIEEKNFGRAFAHFLLAQQLLPKLKTDAEIKNDFVYVLSQWTAELKEKGRIEDVLQCYEQACEICPENEVVHNNMGSQLFQLGYIDEAASCFRRAVRLYPEYLSARTNLENLCSHLVERWHFKMLNDRKRNEYYQRAISRAIQQGHSDILDIGSGTCILSMIAAEEHAASVTACEMSKPIYEMSCDILEANHMSSRINLLNKKSTELEIGIDIPKKVSLVVTETFDAGLLGEHILSTLHHAWDKLLLPWKPGQNGGKVIPSGAKVFACAIECKAIRYQNRLLYPVLRDLDLTGVHVLCETNSQQADQESCEPYTTENLALVPGGYTKLTDVKEFCTFDFNSPQDISNHMMQGMKTMIIPATHGGRLDAIAMWFDLDLGNGVTLTTAPTGEQCCWEQAIYPVLPCHFSKKGPIEHFILKEHDSIAVEYGCHSDCLQFQCTEIIRPAMTSHKTSPDVTSLNLGPTSENFRTFYLDRPEIGRLNDISLNTAYCTAVQKILKTNHSNNTYKLIDISQGFSTIPLQALNMGYQSVCVLNSEAMKYAPLIKHLTQLHEIGYNRVKISEEDIAHCKPEYDVIVADVIEPCGTLRQQILEDLALARVTCLKEGGKVLPYNIDVYAMCIESACLLEDSCVVDNIRTLSFDIASFMNDFKMSTHLDINLSTLPYKRLTDAVRILSFNFNEPLPSNKDLPGFLTQVTKSSTVCMEPGTIHAILFWFEINLTENLKLCTLDTDLHWKQAAIICPESVEVETGAEIKLKTTCKNSCIDIKLI
ncbi:unnamed protein product [Owenia fusiformis]|uniref:Protein arginine N-methyltransferase domain-containing protein n=1 Tax=Owenia fusiformis TaxID=6347 RepID=A0A8S4N975_OWEFU|nr:unnamed protein product [Owenia fusiformis]